MPKPFRGVDAPVGLRWRRQNVTNNTSDQATIIDLLSRIPSAKDGKRDEWQKNPPSPGTRGSCPAWLYHRPVTAASITIALVLACVAWDTWRNRRLHPAFAVGAALIVLSWPLRMTLSQSLAWLRMANWLMS